MGKLIAPKGIREYQPEEYRNYVRGMKIAYEIRKKEKSDRAKAMRSVKKSKGWSFRVTRKGTFVLTVRREPKVLTQSEVSEIITQWKVDALTLWTFLGSKLVSVIDDKTKQETEEFPW